MSHRHTPLMPGWLLWPLVLLLVGVRPADAQPRLLSQTGIDTPGVRTFEPRYPLWSDGASKRRWVLLPAGTAVDAGNPDAWVFPIGTRLWKEFAYGSRIETRMSERLPSGQWRFLTYAWRADGSDADLVPAAGATLSRHDAPFGRYEAPSRADCANCHSGAMSPVLGFSAVQLADALTNLTTQGLVRAARAARRAPPEAGRVTDTDIGSREASGAPGNEIERDARGYLHANCGHCHHAQGVPVPLSLALRVGGSTSPTPEQLERALARMASRNPMTQMPPLGTRAVDPRGLTLVRAWLDLRRQPPAPEAVTQDR